MDRRTFLASSVSSAAAAIFSEGFYAISAYADDLPASLANAKAQFYNYIHTVSDGESGITGSQKIILNSLIRPFDLDVNTPYHNEELFRQYADQTFHGGTEGITGSSPASQAERFSSQYRSLVNAVAYKIDQNHPEIQNKLRQLGKQLDAANDAFGKKVTSLEGNWGQIVNARHLKQGTNEYSLERIAWEAQIRYGDQIAGLSGNIDSLNSQIDSSRRNVYTAAEASVLDNISVLGSAYNVARPWNAQTEISQKAAGAPLTDLILADVTKLAPAIFDSSPLILPVGNLSSFLSAPDGKFGFDTGTQSSSLDAGTSSWLGSGGAKFLGWSLGGGGNGSSSFQHSMSKLNRITLSFTNVAEYTIDRSAWFNPAVLLDKNVSKLIKGRSELSNLSFVSVGLVIVRGTNLQLTFSQSVDANDFSQSSWNAHGGASFMGFSFGAQGGGNNTHYTITHDAAWTTVSFIDAPKTCRVIGVRVEPFMPVVKTGNQPSLAQLAAQDAEFQKSFNDFKSGKIGYIELQTRKVDLLKGLGQQ